MFFYERGAPVNPEPETQTLAGGHLRRPRCRGAGVVPLLAALTPVTPNTVELIPTLGALFH